ncbi:MAG: restriction endonuclease [Burkholderiales bacterium]
MPVFDFKEIPTAASGASRDQFELFAREFLEFMGFTVLVGPDRGTDAGRDLIVEELRTGVAGETRVKWLVSCKHKAHSGKAVSADDEPDIHDRVRTHGCGCFLAFYSTVPSAGLAAKLNAASVPFEVQVFDPEKIERLLLSSSAGTKLAKRFFPISVAAWKKEYPTPANLFNEAPTLTCVYCGKSLLHPKPHGIVVIWSTRSRDEKSLKERTEHLYWCCKGQCDRALNQQYYREGITDGWEDIPDLIIPLSYVRWVMVTLNQLHGGVTYSDEVLKNMKDLLLNLFPLVSRDMTGDERERIRGLSVIPSYLGGWGYDD